MAAPVPLDDAVEVGRALQRLIAVRRLRRLGREFPEQRTLALRVLGLIAGHARNPEVDMCVALGSAHHQQAPVPTENLEVSHAALLPSAGCAALNEARAISIQSAHAWRSTRNASRMPFCVSIATINFVCAPRCFSHAARSSPMMRAQTE